MSRSEHEMRMLDQEYGRIEDRKQERRSWGVTRCFTFGFGHQYPNGYVRITAATAEGCRDEMIRRHGTKWAFEYSPEQIADQEKRFPHMFEVKE